MTEARIVRLEGGPYHGQVRALPDYGTQEFSVCSYPFTAPPLTPLRGRYVPCPTEPDKVWRWDTKYALSNGWDWESESGPLEIKVPEDRVDASGQPIPHPDVVAGHYFGMKFRVLGHEAFERELFRLRRELVSRGRRPGDPSACVRYTVDFKL